MPAYLVTIITQVHTADWWPEYQDEVPRLVRKYGGEYVGISNAPPDAVECLEGSAAPLGIIIVRFPSVPAAKAFIEAPEYAAHRAARMAGTTGQVYVFESDADAPQFA